MIAGTLWVQQDTFMEDIELIEIIRGPAATVWGTNAANGIINVITKKASETQGLFLTADGGSFEHGFFGARYGGKTNDSTPYRFYAKIFTRDHMKSIPGGNPNDAWHNARGGFRLDHTRGIDQFTLQGDLVYSSHGDRLDKSQLNAHPLSKLKHQEDIVKAAIYDRAGIGHTPRNLQLCCKPTMIALIIGY